MKKMVVSGILVMCLAVIVQGEINWDILNQNYGNGTGQVAFNEQYNFLWGSSAPTEFRSDGYTTLTLPTGDGTVYAAIMAISGMPTGSAPMTMEFKLRNHNNKPINLYLSQQSSISSSAWNHLFQINRVYDMEVPNALGDYNRYGLAVNKAPAGFDGSETHVYRVVYDPSIGTRVFVDDNPTVVMFLANGYGAAQDGCNLQWGFTKDLTYEVQVDVYYLRVANGVILPGSRWDVLNQNYGSGTGEVAFNDQYTFPAWGSNAPATEVRSNGFTTLTLPMGDGTVYSAINALAGMPTGDGPVTIEFMVCNHANKPMNVYMSQSNAWTSTWDHILQINRVYNTDMPNTLADWNSRDSATNFAPSNFDGSALHVYRLIHYAGGVTRLYVDGRAVPTGILNSGIGASDDGYNMLLGFSKDPANEVQVDVYYLRIANGALEPTQNSAVEIPVSGLIQIDGTLDEWPASSQWSSPYIFWSTPANQSNMDSMTKIKYAYNDATHMLYAAIQTNQANGGHAVLGFSKDIAGVPASGIGSTQLCFDPQADGEVWIRNEIQYFSDLYSLGWGGGTVDGVVAKYSYDGTHYTYEIAIPLWTNWRAGQEKVKQTLSSGDVVYLYSIMESGLNTGLGTNLTYYGNPNYAEGSFDLAAKLTLMPRAACNGPMLVNPVVYYSFDDAANIGKDSSGHGYDATVAQYPVTDSLNMITGVNYGYFGGAANFPKPTSVLGDGSYAYHNALILPVTQINAAEDIPTSGFSVAAWAHLDSSSNGEHYQLFAAEAGDGNGVVSAHIRVPGSNEKDDTYRLIVSGVGGTTIKDLYLGPITRDQWVHYVGTYDQAANRVSIYINGQLLISALADTTNLTLADNWNNGAKIGSTIGWGRQFVGRMDEFYLFNRALAPVEVKILSGAEVIPGDANGDGQVDVGDLGILAANYGGTGKTWPLGDFNKDGLVDVGDLGILAAHYGQGSSASLDFAADYAKTFGTAADDVDDENITASSVCSGLGLPLIAGLALLGLMLVKLEE